MPGPLKGAAWLLSKAQFVQRDGLAAFLSGSESAKQGSNEQAEKFLDRPVPSNRGHTANHLKLSCITTTHTHTHTHNVGLCASLPAAGLVSVKNELACVLLAGAFSVDSVQSSLGDMQLLYTEPPVTATGDHDAFDQAHAPTPHHTPATLSASPLNTQRVTPPSMLTPQQIPNAQSTPQLQSGQARQAASAEQVFLYLQVRHWCTCLGSS